MGVVASAVLTACFLAGLALVSYGMWLAWHPLGFVVAGVLLVLVPLLERRGQWVSSTT